jgi:predicted Ser/Thr protein kinase
LLKVALEPQSQAPASTASPGKSSAFTPPTPQELNQHFPQLEFLELLGKGGMGAVYKARQKSLDRMVAVKILPPDVGLDPAFAERFTREARALAKLNHPHIVGIHDFGSVQMPVLSSPPSQAGAGGGRGEGAIYYFMMEFVDGVNLRQAQRAGQLKPAEALQIVPQICDALQYAHEEGVVHRDIKPENILLDKRGRVKIADFGLAKLLGKTTEDLTLTGTKQIVGTIPYMAPEQIEGSRDVDHRADIYSLGVTFYEMLTGELPLGRFPPPSQKVQIDVRLDEVVLRTLEKSPDLRYQRAGDVKTEVETISRTPPGKPISDVLKGVAAQVFHGGKRAAGWVADKVTGVGATAEPTAHTAQALQEQPTAAGRAAWKRPLLIWGVIAFAVFGVLLDLSRRGGAPIGTVGGLTLLALLAWKERGTLLGRRLKILLFSLLIGYIALETVIYSPESIFAAAFGIAIMYLVWDAVRAAWNKPTAAAETAPPAAEKQT